MKATDIEKMSEDDLKFVQAYFVWKSQNNCKNSEVAKPKWFYDYGYSDGVEEGSSYCSS